MFRHRIRFILHKYDFLGLAFFVRIGYYLYYPFFSETYNAISVRARGFSLSDLVVCFIPPRLLHHIHEYTRVRAREYSKTRGRPLPSEIHPKTANFNKTTVASFFAVAFPLFSKQLERASELLYLFTEEFDLTQSLGQPW